ncbi:MAG: NAD-dependent protein deacylase [Clostridiales bacterium]|nr:NAD-dependent protein deacylase [Clostridiales bacterium]
MIRRLQAIVDSSDNIVFFGGAGVSTESGIPDFRSSGGLYNQPSAIPPEVILSHSYFEKHPGEFFEFYRSKMIHLSARPNAAHYKLAEMEAMGRLSAVITQNIDGFHQMAGSRNVLELHGSIHRNRCMKCGNSYGVEYILNNKPIPLCSCGGIVKPDVVLYEEPLDNDVIEKAIDYISNADTLIVAGTSLTVYPAAGMVNFFNGRNLVLINRSETPMDSIANLVIHDSVGEVLKKIKV